MQVTSNGKPIELKPSLEKMLVGKKGPAQVDGVVLTPAEGVRAASAAQRLVMTVVVVIGAIVSAASLVAAAVYEPADLYVTVPIAIVGAALLAWFIPFMYRRRVRRAQARADEHAPRMPPPGTTVRVDATGLTIGAERCSWSQLQIEAVEILRTNSGDDPVAYIEWLALSGAARPILLDVLLLKNGRALVDAAWRALRPRPT